jgi:hypothetical protein
LASLSIVLKDREEGDRICLFGFVIIFIPIAIIQHGKDGSGAAEGDRKCAYAETFGISC